MTEIVLETTQLAAKPGAVTPTTTGTQGTQYEYALETTQLASAPGKVTPQSRAIPPAPSAPSNFTLPTIYGTPQDGQILFATNGGWAGYPGPTYAYQWKRGATNVGTNASTYALTSADVGSTITVTITATNGSGSASATSAPTATVSAIDTTPDTFTFTDVTAATRSIVYTSNTITVAGINSPAPISITGGTYSVNGGAFTSASGNVNNGDTVAVRATASSAYSTAANVVLTIGGVSDTFTVTTEAQPGPVVPAWVPNGASAFYDFTTDQGYSGGSTLASSVSDLTVTRASIGYAPDASGQFAANVARRGSWGLLVEEARTNLLIQSEALSNAAWGKLTVGLATDGTLDKKGAPAQKVTASSGSGTHEFYSTPVTTTPGTVYAESIDAKAGTSPYVFVTLQAASGHFVSAVFNLSGTSDITATQTAVGATSGTLVSATGRYLGDGWFRLTLVGSHATTTTYAVFGLAGAATGQSIGAAGDLTFTAAGTESAYFANPQYEVGSFPTSYIPTTSAAATRAADGIVLNVKQAGTLTYKFNDNTTQSAAVTVGNFTIPTTLPRSIIKTITIQ